MPPLLAFADSAELTVIHAGAALDALGRVDRVRILDRAADSADGALPGAEGAALTLLGVNGEVK